MIEITSIIEIMMVWDGIERDDFDDEEGLSLTVNLSGGIGPAGKCRTRILNLEDRGWCLAKIT